MAIESPKVFISYAWTSEKHRDWVINLARSLVQDGVDVKLDEWDTQAGADLNQFMESMVNDVKINNVLMIFDKQYVERSNSREKGVGVEAQIISAQVYKDIGQEKFVGVVRERDEEGKEYIPVYYSSRKYFDLSDDALYFEQYNALLRILYGQPLHEKPTLGKKPDFLNEKSDTKPSDISFRHRALLDSIKKDSLTL